MLTDEVRGLIIERDYEVVSSSEKYLCISRYQQIPLVEVEFLEELIEVDLVCYSSGQLVLKWRSFDVK